MTNEKGIGDAITTADPRTRGSVRRASRFVQIPIALNDQWSKRELAVDL
jgi:hypothetical protein